MKSYTIPLSLLGAALVLVGGLAYLLNPEAGYVPLFNLGLGIVAIVVAGWLNPDLFRLYGRWINAFWGGIMVLGIIVMVNFLADRYPRRLDMTEGKLHSLADLTLQTLEGLDKDVKALAFMEKGSDEKLEGLLKEFGVHSHRFSYEFIDPDRDPELTQKYGITRYNTLVIESGGEQQKITELEEKEITNALLKVIRDRREVVYVTVGHGEAGLGEEPHGLGLLQKRLEDIDYAVEDSLFLAREGEVPDDCAVLLIPGPQTSFLENEVAAIRRYLEKGGSVLALLDPLYQTGLEGLFAEWGVRVGNDFVIDTSGIGSIFGLDFTTPVAVDYGEHPITEKHRGLMTFYQLGRSVEFEPGDDTELDGVDLVKTSEQGWAESDLGVLQAKGKQTVSLDKGVDRPGPISLAVAVTKKMGEGKPAPRLVVFGDSDFATNQFFNYQGNGDLVLNALSWLAEDESLISIRPRQAGHNPIALTESQGDWIFWIAVVILPAAVALLGMGVVSRKGRWSLADLAAAGLGIVLSLGVVALLNFIGDRYHYRIDFTEGKLFTLDDETKQLIEPLEDEGKFVHVKSFINEMEGMHFQDILKEYKYLSHNFDYELLDPQKNALQVKQYGIRERGTSIIEALGDGQARTERITDMSEEALSNAIRRALMAQDQKIYFAQGHGEGDLGEVDGTGFSILKGRLKEMNFEVVDGLDLAEGVPDDATMLVVLSPDTRFAEAEVEAVRAYLKRGGSALFLLDPSPTDTGLEGLLDDYSIEVGHDFVVDRSLVGQMFGAGASIPVVLNYGDHPVTSKVGQGVMSFFPMARSIELASHRRLDPEVTRLALTDRNSWSETDLGPISGGSAQAGFDPDADRPGPISLGVAAEADADTSVGKGEKTRIVVFGDSDFATNQYFGQQANGQLVVGSISWLSEDEESLTIPPKQAGFNPINLIGNAGSVILWISVFILPFAVALSGLVMVLKRGYENYADGFAAWLMYTFIGNAIFFTVMAVVGISEGNWANGEGNLLVGLLSFGVGYGLYLRERWVWGPALLLSVLSAVIGFWAIPNETVQLLYAAVFAVNAAILVWVRRAFDE